ncbi:MAG: hypothetical protein GY720_24350, partial [bacterium]|nr:hypothetical protein [bacterium]
MIHRSLSHLILTVGIVGLLAAGSPTTTSATPSSVRQRAALCDVAESDGVVVRFASEKLWVPERPLSREIPVTLPGGEYTLRLITSDADHPQNPSQQNERWVLDLLDETGQIVYSSPPTPDLADEDIASDDAVGQLTTYVDVAAVRARHLGTEKATIAGPDSITPLCAVFV